MANVVVGNQRVLDAVKADPAAHALFSNFQRSHPSDTTVAVVVNGSLVKGRANGKSNCNTINIRILTYIYTQCIWLKILVEAAGVRGTKEKAK